MPSHESDIYHMLQGQDIDALTVGNLDSATGRTFINPSNNDFWKGIMHLSHVLKAARCYPYGLPVPEASAISVKACPPSETVTFQPEGTELWKVIGAQITGAAGTPIVSIELYDGAESVIMHKGTFSTSPASLFPFESGFIIDNAMYLQFTNTDGSNAVNVSLAYHKVGL